MAGVAIVESAPTMNAAWGSWHTLGPPETERIALVLVGSSTHRDCDGIVTRQAFEETWTPAILLKYKKTANIDAEQLSSSEDEMTDDESDGSV